MSTNKHDEIITDDQEDDIDFSSLTPKERDDLILEMHKEEMLEKQKDSVETTKKTSKRKPRKRRRKSEKNKNQYPGFGRVAFKMATAMTFSMVFILIGPILFVMAVIGKAGPSLFGDGGAKIWVNTLLGLFGLGLVVIAWYLFKYLIKD